MQKVYEDEYSMEHYKILQEKYGKSNWEFIETGELDKNGDPYYILKTTWERAVDENHNQQIEEERHQMMLESNKKQKRAHKLLWDFIEHNIQRWWD